MLIALTPDVTKAAGEPLLPTYTYARHYKHGDILKPHRDRPACDVSLTLNLSSDAPWPIYMDGKPVLLEPGDGAMYRGCLVEHYRTAFTGRSCVQVFLHWVRSRGEHAAHYFDRIEQHKIVSNRSILLS